MDDSGKPSPNARGAVERISALLRLAESDKADQVRRKLPRELNDEIGAANGVENAEHGERKQSVYDFLRDAPQSALFAALIQERAQTIAAILVVLPSEFSPRVIRALDEFRQIEVLRTLADADVQPCTDVANDLIAQLCDRIADVQASTRKKTPGVVHVSNILRACDRETEWTLMRSLAHSDPVLTGEVSKMLFDFEDIAQLPDHRVCQLVRHVLIETWAIALKRCSESVRRKVKYNLDPRAAQKLHAEMNYYRNPPPSEIDACQQRVVDVARKLELNDVSDTAPRRAA